MHDLTSIWSKCVDTLGEKGIVEDELNLNTYYRDSSSLVAINNHIATITNDFQWNIAIIEEKKVEIESIISDIINENITVEFLTTEQFNKKKETVENEEFFKDNLKPSMTFDNFVVGSSNRMAQNAALLVSQKPGNNFNPLFLYSNPGLGKTHLLNAIGNYAKAKNPDLKILYITSKDFVDEIVNSIKSSKTDLLYKRYRSIDILLIDDIQFLFGKEKSSEMFFHIFNEIINNNKQIVITSDKMPEELNGIEDRLVSRFKSGLSFGIDPPEFETAKAILEKKIENLDNSSLIVTEEVIDFMVTSYCNDIRSLEGQLKRLFFCSIMNQTNYIDMSFASEIFKDQPVTKKTRDQLTSEFILKTTAEFYYLTISQLVSKSRTQNLTIAREICMYLMRELLDITFSEIGFIFSNRDHSTVMKACKRVETKMKKDKDYHKAVQQLKTKLGTI